MMEDRCPHCDKRLPPTPGTDVLKSLVCVLIVAMVATLVRVVISPVWDTPILP